MTRHANTLEVSLPGAVVRLPSVPVSCARRTRASRITRIARVLALAALFLISHRANRRLGLAVGGSNGRKELGACAAFQEHLLVFAAQTKVHAETPHVDRVLGEPEDVEHDPEDGTDPGGASECSEVSSSSIKGRRPSRG